MLDCLFKVEEVLILLLIAPPKFVQSLITAMAKLVKQRWSSIQDFCAGVVDQRIQELASSGAKL